MVSRREFLQAAAAAGALLAGSGLGPLGRVAAQQRLTEESLLAFPSFGNATILHLTDVHAQLKPVYFREPSINLGVGEARGVPPHLTDAEFRSWYKIAAGSADAYALTSEDFVGLAKGYGRMGGMDRIATLVRSIRASRGGDATLLLDGGDTWQGSWTALKTRAADMAEIMTALGVEAMVGHWEFTLGEERVKEIADALPFPFLAQNIRDNEWQEKVFEPRKTFVKGGARIAVIGQAFPRTPIANPRWMIPKWEFGIREEEMQRQVDEARAEGADCVVVLSHNGFDVDRKMASRVKGIDIVLTAHTHDALPEVLKVGNTILVASGSHGKFISRIDIDAGGGRLKGFRHRLIPVFSDAIRPDPEMAALVAKWRGPYEADLGRVLGQTESLLYRRGNFNGTFDDLIAGAMLKERDAEIALTPGFRWGATLLPGDPITFEALANATAMTYPNCYRQQMTGEQLKTILEDVADNIFHPDPYFQGGGDMVRVGGMGYRIDVAKPMGERISEMTHLASGKPIDAARSYVVAGWASVGQGVEGPPIWEVVAGHVAREKTIRLEPNASVKVVAG